jgi:glycosyltransferase involved in cell wall biosynthesis
MKVVLITNNPAPYRVPVFNILASTPGIEFMALYCSEREPDRFWSLPELKHNHRYLEGYAFSFHGRYIHMNKGIGVILKENAPDVVITCGFNPTMLLAWLFCLRNKVHHITMSDGTSLSESGLSFIHRYIRRIVYNTTAAFVGASNQTLSMYTDYGVAPEKLFQSHLCVDNASFVSQRFEQRTYDVMFSGQFIKRKMPLFFCAVVKMLAEKRKKLSVLILGSGPEEEKMRRYLAESPGLQVNFAGYVSQDELPKYYGSAKILLFPTNNDPWGIVANEACASGTPVVTCENAGVAGELVRDGYDGLVLPLDVRTWIVEIEKILNSPDLWLDLSKNALKEVEIYNFDAAANGILKACDFSLNK